MSVKIIGSYLSPYVRTILVLLHLKGVAYEIDPIVPFFGDERFSAMSPLRRIPVLIDDGVTLSDSSVIAQYLEERYPQPALYPADIGERARARYSVDAARWPLTAAFVERVLALDGFMRLKPFEDELLRTPIAQHRAALAELGAPLTAETYATAAPRPGIMRI